MIYKKTKRFSAFFIALALICLTFQYVYAFDTTINLKVDPAYNCSVILNIINPLEGTALKTFENYSNNQATMTFIYSTDSAGLIGITSIAQMSGIILKSKRFGNFTSGGTINLNLFENSAPQAQASSNLTNANLNASATSNATASGSQANSTLLTGYIVNNSSNIKNLSEESFFSKINWKKILLWIAYIIGGLIILVALFFGGRFAWQNIKNIKLPSSSSSKGDVVLKAKDTKVEKELYEAERKIKEAQETIDFIKNRKNKLTEAERRFEEAKREVERLRRL